MQTYVKDIGYQRVSRPVGIAVANVQRSMTHKPYHEEPMRFICESCSLWIISRVQLHNRQDYRNTLPAEIKLTLQQVYYTYWKLSILCSGTIIVSRILLQYESSEDWIPLLQKCGQKNLASTVDLVEQPHCDQTKNDNLGKRCCSENRKIEIGRCLICFCSLK